jgi:hypothetical protein
MSLNCFFGSEVSPGDGAQAPVIPPHSVLFATQACVSADNTYTGRMTLTAQPAGSQKKLALCTLHPANGVYHAGVQHLFAKAVKFALEVDHVAAGRAENHPADKKAKKTVAELTAGCKVHLTGYYEADDREDEDEEDSEESDDGEDFVAPAKKGGAAKGGAAKGGASRKRVRD